MSTCRAFEITGQRQFRLVERQRREPLPGEVRLRVHACGICHFDVLAVEGQRADSSKPIVPGHEIAGVVEAVGPGVTAWHVGERLGVGFLNGHRGECEPCRRGDFVNCAIQQQTGTTVDGGYAEVAYARASGLIRLPDEMDAVDLAPLLCAGLTVYRALLQAGDGALPGALVAIQGIAGWVTWASSTQPNSAIGSRPLRAVRKGQPRRKTRSRPLHRQRGHQSRGRAAGIGRGRSYRRDRLQRRVYVAADCRPGRARKADRGRRRRRTHRGADRRCHLRHLLTGRLTHR